MVQLAKMETIIIILHFQIIDYKTREEKTNWTSETGLSG